MKITALFALSLAAATAADRSTNTLVAHEWGTFTSVADANGNPVGWMPLAGPPDLPCFVYTIGQQFKPLMFARVRMETPVLYFYAPEPTALSVRVDFPQGNITEWYPQSSKPAKNPSSLPTFMEWDNVKVLPGAQLTFPSGKGASHYYAARATDAAPLRIGDEQEKMIFYRGVGQFYVPIRPRITQDGMLEIRNVGSETIRGVIVFESQAGKVGYRLLKAFKGTVTREMPELTGDLAELQQRLATELVESGLYPKEAAAMIETWRDSWFEDGMRVFYLVPREQVDQLLPLKIAPQPSSIGRVFVGRVEVLSPRTSQTIETAAKAGDTKTLAKFGRFLEPFAKQMAASGKAGPDLNSMRVNPAACIP